MTRFANTARMILAECSASQRMIITMTTVPTPLMMAPSCTVEYSSLAIGIGPVSRTRA